MAWACEKLLQGGMCQSVTQEVVGRELGDVGCLSKEVCCEL